MSISRVAFISPYYSHFYTSLYRDKRFKLKDLQMFYKYFTFIKEVIKNYLTFSIIKGAHYLIIIKFNVIDLRPPFINWINNCKHLILRI
jgi:hypothetical protein